MMKKFWKWLAIGTLTAGMAFSVGGLTACDDKPGDTGDGPQSPSEPTKLSTPVLSRDGNIASWAAVDGATLYKYQIDNGAEQEIASLFVTLTEGQTVRVKAVGDGVDYTDSDWSNSVTYTIATLNRPVVTMDGNVASWTAIAGASGYKYKINDGAEQTADGLSVTLQSGQTIRVKAVGDGVYYKDSLWSIETGCEAETLSTPVLSKNGNVVSWTAVAGASGYKYKVNNGAEQTADGLSVALQDGDSIVVKAVGDGVTYKDSDWSTAVEHTATKLSAPVLSKNGNVVSWTAIAGASEYKYKINGGAEQTADGLSVALQDGDSIVVKAVGDGVTYKDSDWSTAVEHTATKLSTPVLSKNGNVVSWTAVDGASEYKYKINDGAEQTADELSVALQDGDSIVVKAVGDGVTYKDSDWSTAVSFEAIALDTPTLARVGNQVRWTAVANATAYVYQINDGAPQTTSELYVVLEVGQSIKVKAISDNILYKDGEYSASMIYELAKLGVTTVELSGNKATWTAVENASMYVYKIDGGEEKTTYEQSVLLEIGQTIAVKAVGDGIDYQDGDYCAEKTYQATYLVNDCESVSSVEVGAGTSISLTSSHSTQGASAIKVTTSAAWSQVKIRLQKEGKPLTKDDLNNALYIEFDIYAEQEGTVLFYFNQQLTSLVKGANKLRLSGRDILYQVQENAAAYDFETGMAYFQVWQAGHTIYLDNFVMTMGVRPALVCGSGMESVIDVVNNCDSIGLVQAAAMPTLSTENVFEGEYSTEVSSATDWWWFNLRVADAGLSLAEIKAKYETISFNIYSSYPDINGAAANSLYLGNGEKYITLMKNGDNVVVVNTADLTETTYTTDGTGYYITFVVGGACTIRIDNVVAEREAVTLGNVFILGDSYSTFEEYIAYNSAAAWYTEIPRNTNGATVGEAQTDVTSATQTWWGQLLAATNSNLLTNASYSGTTVCNTTYSALDGTATSFTTRLQKFIDEGYFTQNTVDTFFLFGGTNDAWAYDQNLAAGLCGDYIGTPKYADWTQEDMKQVLPAYAYMINQIKTNVPTARLVVLLNVSWTNASIVAGYKEICDHYGVEYIEVALSSTEVQQLHPNKAGMTSIKDQIISHFLANP